MSFTQLGKICRANNDLGFGEASVRSNLRRFLMMGDLLAKSPIQLSTSIFSAFFGHSHDTYSTFVHQVSPSLSILIYESVMSVYIELFICVNLITAAVVKCLESSPSLAPELPLKFPWNRAYWRSSESMDFSSSTK